VRRTILLSSTGAGVVIVLALAAGYVYYFSGLRSAPKPLSLATSSTAASGSGSELAGTWSVASGSVARYRVNEVFAGTTSNHEAVAETSDLAGSLSVQSAAAGHTLGDLKITARLTSLHSIDTVAGYDVANRDRIVQRTLGASQYPEADFAAKNVQLPADLTVSSSATLTIPGQLTIHGVTKTEQITVKQLQVSGGTAEVVGQTSFNMTDFGIQPPALPLSSVHPEVTLEFDLRLSKA